jgi:drug/metabolite transporter (DMT)-like permease
MNSRQKLILAALLLIVAIPVAFFSTYLITGFIYSHYLLYTILAFAFLVYTGYSMFSKNKNNTSRILIIIGYLFLVFAYLMLFYWRYRSFSMYLWGGIAMAIIGLVMLFISDRNKKPNK